MKPALEQLLEARHADLKHGWTERIRENSRYYAQRPLVEVERSVGRALSAITACVAGRGGSEIADYTAHLARLRLEHGIPQVETLGAFLAGRDLVLERVHQSLPPEQYLEAMHQI